MATGRAVRRVAVVSREWACCFFHPFPARSPSRSGRRAWNAGTVAQVRAREVWSLAEEAVDRFLIYWESRQVVKEQTEQHPKQQRVSDSREMEGDGRERSSWLTGAHDSTHYSSHTHSAAAPEENCGGTTSAKAEKRWIFNTFIRLNFKCNFTKKWQHKKTEITNMPKLLYFTNNKVETRFCSVY